MSQPQIVLNGAVWKVYQKITIPPAAKQEKKISVYQANLFKFE